MKLLFSILKPYRRYITVALIIKMAGTLVELAIPYILSYILDYVVPEKKVWNIVFWGVAMIVCAILACVGNKV